MTAAGPTSQDKLSVWLAEILTNQRPLFYDVGGIRHSFEK
jgi:hypothetical protein